MAGTRQPDDHRAHPSAPGTTRPRAAARKPTSRQPTTRRGDDAEIADLIANVRSVRVTLEADLSAAAGAIDAGQIEVARDILAADRTELAVFNTSARNSLTEQPDLAGGRENMRSRRPRSRVLLALPAVPLVGALAMTAAAALGGSPSSDHQPTRHRAAITAPAVQRDRIDDLPRAADSTLLRLEHVVTHHPRAAQVLAVAADLHQQLTAMIATSDNNPQQLGVIRHLLTLEQEVLEGHDAPGSTLALKASREISKLLTIAPVLQPRSSQPTQTTTKTYSPSTASSTTPAPTTTAPPKTVPRKHHRRLPSSHSTSSSPKSSPKPKKSRYPLFGEGVFNSVL